MKEKAITFAEPSEAPDVLLSYDYASPKVAARIHPHRPMPNPVTGELLIDPDIQLKTPGMDLAVSFFYSSFNAATLTEYGYGRSSSLRSRIGILYYEIVDQDETVEYLYSITRGDFTQVLGSDNYPNVVSPIPPGNYSSFPLGGVADWSATETFPDGMAVTYGGPVGPMYGNIINGPYQWMFDVGISQVTYNDGRYMTYLYNNDVITTIVVDDNGLASRLVTLTYDASLGEQSLLTSIEDWSTRMWTFSYTAGYLNSYSTPNGCTTYYTYSLAGSPNTVVYTIQDPLGYISTYSYDQYSRVVSMAAGPAIWTWSYTNGQSLMIEPSGAISTYTYDSTGDLTSLQHPENYTTTYTYDTYRRKLTESTPAGLLSSVTYGPHVVSAVADPLGNITTTTYGPFGVIPWSTIDPLGGIQTLTYLGYGPVSPNTQVDQLGRTTTYTWGISRISMVMDPLGRITTYNYDYRDYLYEVIAANGVHTSYTYDVLGRVISMMDGLSRVTTYAYDLGDNLLSTTTPDGAVWNYIYNTCLLQTAIDPLGNRTTYTYGRFSDKTSMMDPDGNLTTYVWDNQGYQTGTIDPLGHRTTVVYNTAHQKIADVNQLGYATSYTYDNAGRLSSTIDPRGYRTTNVYNARDLIAVRDANGNYTSFVYDALGRQVAQATPLNNRTTTVYDLAGQVTSTVDPSSHATFYAYDLAGNQTTITDARGYVWSNVFDTVNRQIAQADPLGHRSTTVYDAASQVVNTQDERGYVTTNTYDPVGRLKTAKNPVGATTTNVYDLAGRQTSTTDALGRRWQTGYDSLGRTVTVTSPLGYVATNVFDVASRLIATQDATGAVTTNVYNGASWQTSMIDPLDRTTTFTYDHSGNAIGTQDPRSYAATTVYDGLNRVSALQDQLGHFTSYVYDADSRNTVIQDARNYRVTMVYSPKAELLELTNQLGNTTSYVYDALGNVTLRTFPSGKTATYGLDPLSRTTLVAYSDGSRVTQVYDPVGNRVTLQDSVGTTTFAYDPDSRMVGRTDPGALVQAYAYDLADQRTTLKDTSGQVRSYTHDLDGRITAYADPSYSVTLTLDNDGREIQSSSSTGVFRRNGYDAAGQLLTQLDVSDTGAMIQGLTNTYDPNGNKLTIVDTFGLTNLTYGYDAKNRLVSEVATGTAPASIDYAYDPTDNLIQNGSTYFTVNAAGQIVTNTYAPGGSTATTTYTYDLDGNLVSVTDSAEAIAMGYDCENRLSSHQQTGLSAYYSYNGDGKKKAENTEEGITTIVWDGDDYLDQLFTAASNASMFVYQQVPVSVTHGAPFLATLVFANEGPSTWTSASTYQLGSAITSVWGVTNTLVPSSTTTSNAMSFPITFTAPATAGIYPFQWQMNEAGTKFGELSDLFQIQVV